MTKESDSAGPGLTVSSDLSDLTESGVRTSETGTPPPDPSPTLTGGRRRAAVAFIFVTALLDVISFGLMIPVLPNLVKQLVGGDTALAAVWAVAFSTVWGVMQFFGSPVLGLLSDRFGRRPIILISIFGLGVDFLFMALAPTLWWLFLGRMINGATAAAFGTSAAYIADVTEPENRAKAFGLINAAWGIGFIVGPALGGLLAESTLFGLLDQPSLRTPFFFAAAVALANGLYGLFILPESLPPERRVALLDWRKANPVGSVQLLRSHRDLLGLASVNFLAQLAHVVFPAIFVLYTGHRYGWTPLEMGFAMAGTGVASAIVSAFLVGPVVQRIGERGALLMGLTCMTLAYAGYASAPTAPLYIAVIPLGSLGALSGPGIQGLMTRRVGRSEQGQLQGANSMVMGITSLLGPSLFGLSFAWSVSNEAWLNLPGFAIFIAMLLSAAATVIAVRVARPVVPPLEAQVTQTSSATP